MNDNPGFCYGNKMLLDQACLQLQNDGYETLHAFNVSSECSDCVPQPLMTLKAGFSQSVILSTTYDVVLKFVVGNRDEQATYSLGQHGHYKVYVNGSNDVSWSVTHTPDYIYSSLWYTLSTFIFAVALWAFVSWLLTLERVARYLPNSFLLSRNVVIRDADEEDLGGSFSRQRSSGDSSPLIPTPPIENIKESNRTTTLDVFRGITVALMIFVNYGGGKYSIFQHSPWDGLTIADLVFPWFVWIMGASVALSIQSQLRNTVSRKRLFVKVLTRCLILIALGIILNSLNNNNIHHLRIPGVLQRLGLTFLIVGTVASFTMVTPNAVHSFDGRTIITSDWVTGWKQTTIIISLVALHICLVTLVPVDGCPKPYFGPGGLHMNGTAFNCTGGLTGYVDRIVFGVNHIYQHPTSSEVYHSTVPFDPEGLLGTLMTAYSMHLGYFAGRILIETSSSFVRCFRWLMNFAFYGVMTLTLLISGFDSINKNLWSLSFVFASSSLAFMAFTTLYIFIDGYKIWNGAPFRQVGRNALFLYVGHIVMQNALPWNWSPIDLTTHSQILWMNLWSTALWVVLAVIMDWCQIFVTI